MQQHINLLVVVYCSLMITPSFLLDLAAAPFYWAKYTLMVMKVGVVKGLFNARCHYPTDGRPQLEICVFLCYRFTCCKYVLSKS